MVPSVETNKPDVTVDAHEGNHRQVSEQRFPSGESRALRRWRLVLAVLVILCLVLAILVWSQLLRAFP